MGNAFFIDSASDVDSVISNEDINEIAARNRSSLDPANDGISNVSDFQSHDLSCDHELSACLMEHCLDETAACLDPFPLLGRNSSSIQALFFSPQLLTLPIVRAGINDVADENCDDSKWQYCDLAHKSIFAVDQCCPKCAQVTRDYYTCLLVNTIHLNSSFCSATACDEWSGCKSLNVSELTMIGLLIVFFAITSESGATIIVLLALGASISLVFGAGLI